MTEGAYLAMVVPKAHWLTSNQRPHWAVKWRKTQALRQHAALIARAQRVPRFERALVTFHIGYPPRAHRADPGNTHPTTKAILDGLVDAGVFPDDDSAHVVDGGHRRGAGSGRAGYYAVWVHVDPLP